MQIHHQLQFQTIEREKTSEDLEKGTIKNSSIFDK